MAVARVSQLVCTRPVHLSACVSKLVQFNLSDIGEGIREVTVRGWHVKEHDVVAQFDNICEVESDKATVTITSRFDGRVTKLYHGVGDRALVGHPLLDIDVPDEGSDSGVLPTAEESPRTAPPSATEDLPPEETWNKSLATPAVRRIAMEHKIKLSDVKGSGKNGRVMKEDILAFVEKKKSGSVDQVRFGDKAESKLLQKTSVSPLTLVQRVMARKMAEATKIPCFVFSEEIDVTKLVKLMSEAKEAADKKDIKLSYVPMFIKAISKGLSEHPILNSSYDEEGQIIYKHYHNIGVAFDSPNGLIVPNIKNVQDLSILDISAELNRLKNLAHQMKLSPSDITGGTFTVSNIGSIAGTYATPTIMAPEVCIVAIGRIQKLPRFDSTGKVVATDILTTSWTADHRIIDGATVARCCRVFKSYIEHPIALLLDL